MALMSGCGDQSDGGWRSSTDPLATSGLIWASGSTVHLGDGSTIDVGQTIGGFVVAGDGVFFAPERDGEPDWDELMFASSKGPAISTGLNVSSNWFAASPDGSHLAFLDGDGSSGEATMRIYDLSSGEEFTSDDGMDTSGNDDPVDHFLESEVEILGITDDSVYARVINGDYAYDLATGDGRPLGDDEEVPGYGADELVSPNGEWRIVDTPTRQDRVTPAEGSEGDDFVPSPGSERWDLERWADETTVVGNTVEGPGQGETVDRGDSMALMSCVVPAGDCEVFEETTGQVVVFSLGDTDYFSGTYPDGRGQG